MDFSLKISDKELIHVGVIPHDAVDEIFLSMNEHETELDGFLKLVGKNPLTPIPKAYQKMCKTLNLSGREAALAVPKKRLEVHLQECARVIQDVLCNKENADYLVTYLTIQRCLQRLNRSSIDKQKLTALVDDTPHDTTVSVLKSFLPRADGLCEKTEYSTVNTVTGRLTVVRGPQILTAPSQVRACLRSKYENGKVLQIDIISAEPKFALHLKGEEMPVDVYTYVAKNILRGTVERHHAKLITLCALYGQSPKNLERKLPPDVSARGVIRETRKYFDYDYLKSRLKSEANSASFRNAVGRPIEISDKSDHLLISYYLQSSVAEGAILMFSDFIEKFQNYCAPIFIIHDALILDCQEEFANALLEKSKIKLSLGDWKFDAEVKVIGDI